jgi:MYXO-CTERM domain-containing protein
MKNRQRTSIYLLAIIFLIGFAFPASAQKKQKTPKQLDSVEVMSTSSGADPTGPTYDNPAHGKPLDTTGVVKHKTVTYTYFKKPAPAIKDSTVDSTTYNQPVNTMVTKDSLGQLTNATGTTTCTNSGGCCWGWAGLLGLLGLFGLRKQRKTNT